MTGFFFHSALGRCDEAIEVYTSVPLTEFDGIVGLALAYFKKGLLEESIKGKIQSIMERFSCS